MKIGLVGEAPNDTRAIQNLLSRNYKHLEFVELLEQIDGSMLDNRKAISRLLRIEYESHRPDLVIFIRDLDSHEKDRKKKLERKDTFNYSNGIVNGRGLSLLNIYEIEALILADIDVFNREYGINVKRYDDVMLVPDPKERLMEASRKGKKRYNETHNAQLFLLLNFEILISNCRYFSAFVKQLNKAIF